MRRGCWAWPDGSASSAMVRRSEDSGMSWDGPGIRSGPNAPPHAKRSSSRRTAAPGLSENTGLASDRDGQNARRESCSEVEHQFHTQEVAGFESRRPNWMWLHQSRSAVGFRSAVSSPLDFTVPIGFPPSPAGVRWSFRFSSFLRILATFSPSFEPRLGDGFPSNSA